MNKHTPKPWIAREVNGGGWPGQRGFAIDFNEDQEQVVDFVYEEADAHLIASAPDLLEALENMLAAFDNPILRRKLASDFNAQAILESHAAIAKAKGKA